MERAPKVQNAFDEQTYIHHMMKPHVQIFNEATCPEISQEQFLANERNKKKTDTWKKKYKYFSTLKLPLTKWLRQIHLYGGNPRTSACDLNHLHYTLFTQSATKARSTLARLPPTVDAARFHALRSYLQIQKWLGHEKNPL
ncbi:hypothetical protein AVEN_56102-1 [Araneus ventricosus]|uniref:Uncharacterized protein n=1 Tax=Araneus ventricosus TaxID=182803 RepID=A0A4Y2KFG2_ARAVE|nr:hypothetical protein AVEN_56102-1 [Araneus ventricosus]